MKIRQRIAGILTSMVCTASLLCVNTSSLIAEAEICSEIMQYGDYLLYEQVDEDEDGTFDYVEITGCDEAATVAEIPEEIDGLPVKYILHGSFEYCESLTEVTIPANLYFIGYGAFDGCTSLANINVAEDNDEYCSVDGVLFSKDKTELVKYPAGSDRKEYTIPEGVEMIQEEAFAQNGYLESVVIPEGVTDIYSYAFVNCVSLAEVTLPKSVVYMGSDAFTGTELLRKQDGVKYVGDWAVSCSDSLTSADIKDGTRMIDDYAFYGSMELTAVTIPDSVTTIGNSAFSNCSALANVSLGNGVTTIGENAFYCCEKLADITLPESVVSVGYDAFLGTALFDNQTGIKYVSDWIVGCDDDVTSADIKKGTKGIADQGFCNCMSITEVFLPDSVKSIGNSAFSNCTYLAAVSLGSGVTSIGDSAFYGCTSLAGIIVPENVTSIGYYAFEECASLESITIMNPECEITDVVDTIPDTATIYGYKNSTAQAYAENYDITFVALDSEQPTETIDPSLVTKYGDLNNDDDVSVSDVVKLNLYLLNKTENPLDAVALANADCVRDGIIDSSDSSLIMNYIAMMVDYDKLGTL